MVSYESDSNDPNSDKYKDSVASTQHTYGSGDAEDSVEAVNDDKKSVTSINE